MCWVLRFGFRVEVVSIDAFQVCLKSLPNFCSENLAAFRLIFMAKIWQRFALFSWWKSDSISPYFRGRNLVVLYLRCVIACQTLFLSNFRYENMTIGIPHFYGENSTKFRIWCGRVSHLCIQRVSTFLHRDEPKPSKILSMLMCVEYMGKPLSLGEKDQDNLTTMIVHTM